jgi:acyl-CoA thioesterase-1
MKLLPLSALLLALASRAPAIADPASDDLPPCDMPADLIAPAAPLTRVADALTGPGKVEILAIGSGSTVGDSGGSTGPAFTYRTPEASFPFRMLDVLRQMRPRAQFNLTVKGGRNMTADAMYSTLVQELAGNHYDLVLWQTGTVEAVRGARPQMLREVLEQGVDAAVKAEADVVLIDPQFSRFLRANTDMNPYEMVLEQIAGMPGVSLFRRFELTQGWVSSGQIDLERVGQDKRDKTIALLNTCLGHALARYVLTGTEAR